MSDQPNEVEVKEETKVEEPKEICPEQEEKLKQAKIYYAEIRRGAAFIVFMVKDIMRNRNRKERRRIMQELAQGKVCREAIEIYALRLEEILVDINKQLETSVVKEVKEDKPEDGK